MADVKQILKKYGGYIELGAYLIAFISTLLPFWVLADEDDIEKEIEKSFSKYMKRRTMFGVRVEKESGSYLGEPFSSGVAVLIFVIISAIIVAVNTFARNVIENLKNNNKNMEKAIDAAVELVPLLFTFISFILACCSAGSKEVFGSIGINRGVGVYLLIIALIIALAVRIAYVLMVKEYIELFKKPEFENKEVKAEQAEQTNEEVKVEVN